MSSNAVKAVSVLINSFEANAELAKELVSIFEAQEDFLSKVKRFDATFEKHPSHEAISEYAFDLLMAHHLQNNNDDEDYFDSKEWQDIEDKTIERGTELLNILLYISEANETDAPINIEDFLYEFLLVDEDEFQDEHRIYEELIANQDLVDEDAAVIVEVGKRLPEELEISELFVPLLILFKDSEAEKLYPEDEKLLTPIQRALANSLVSFNNS